MKIDQKTYTYGNLQITHTIWTGKKDITKFNSVERLSECGTFWETLNPNDPDYKKAMILMINEKKRILTPQ